MFPLPRSEGRKILDIGCGVGGMAIFMQNNLAPQSVDGINISHKQIRIARKLAAMKNCSGKVRFKVASASQIPYNNCVFDIITAVECAFHFLRKDLFIEETYRVLKPTGKLLMTDIILTEDSRLEDSFSRDLSESCNGLQVPGLARISDWVRLLSCNHFTNIKLEDMTGHTAVDLNRLIKNSLNKAISSILEKNQTIDEKKAYKFRKWDQSWYMLLGRLFYNKVLKYYIISAEK
jgi:cyclopropane fatty-acyl-phospholipid synthase-like methyltransferase